MDQAVLSRWFAKRLAYLVGATVLFACLLGGVMSSAAGDEAAGPAWAGPSVMAARKVGALPAKPVTPFFFYNLDCTSITYRMVGGSDMRDGCFTETAFGMMDSDADVVIFNGTDEGLAITPYTANQILAPWPQAGNLVSLMPISTGGALLGLYTDPVAALGDQMDASGRLAAKRLAAAPDLTLKDASGTPLVVNPQTLAFADGGAWLVAETLSGSFVRVDLGTLSAMPFAPAYGGQGSPALLQSRVAATDGGRFVAVANNYATQFRVYDLAGCGATLEPLRALPPLNCGYHDFWPFLASRIPGLKSVRRVRFIDEGLLGFDAVADDPANSGTYELAPSTSISSLTGYLGLGDSYTSGEGAFDYLAGTDTDDNLCHLSVNSYPLLVARDLFGSAGGHSVACSGAVINDIGSTSGSYHGQARGAASLQKLLQAHPDTLEAIESGFQPGMVAQHRFVKRWQPEVVTVSIGGNDIGFGNILQKCVAPGTCYDSYEDRLELINLIDRTVPRWTALFNQLKSEAPDAQLYAIGYPQVALSSGTCGLNVRLNRTELELAEGVIDRLDADIRTAAETAGVSYIDISSALYGHRLCEAAGYDVAMNGLTAGKDAGVLGIGVVGHESYHPNALGHELVEQVVLKSLRGQSSDGTTASGVAPDLLDAPRTGRTVYNLVPETAMVPALATRGSSIQVYVSGAAAGLRPHTTYSVRLDGGDDSPLGSLTSDASANLDGTVELPADTTAGGHTIDIVGPNQADEPLDVNQPLYVAASATDSDGDGIENLADSCPTIANSGQDADADGIDDVCDGLIGPAVEAPVDATAPQPTSQLTSGAADPGSGSAPPPNAKALLLGNSIRIGAAGQ